MYTSELNVTINIMNYLKIIELSVSHYNFYLFSQESWGIFHLQPVYIIIKCELSTVLLLAHLSQRPKSDVFYQSVYVVRCRCRRRILFRFSSSSLEPTSHFQPNFTKISLGEENSTLFEGRAFSHLFPRGDNIGIAKTHCQNFQLFSSRTTGLIKTKLIKGNVHSMIKW